MRWGQRIRMFFAPRRRVWAAALALGTLLALALNGWCGLQRVCAQIRGQTLRLHVLANSDDALDQQQKLLVRDALVACCGELLAGARDVEEALALAQQALPQLQRAAKVALEAAGSTDAVQLQLCEDYFTTRHYDGYTLPAGRYHTLRVTIGQGRGHNWWCVLFPPLCIPAASADAAAEAEALWGEEGLRLASGGYQVRFALVEWAQALYERLRGG